MTLSKRVHRPASEEGGAIEPRALLQPNFLILRCPINNPMTTGNLYIVSAPSGAGKTSLVKGLVETTPEMALSVSHTTRPPRPGEENGRHYHFVSTADFDAMRAAGLFLEHARVFDNFYGTSRTAVSAQLDTGSDVILEIDFQGALQIKQAFANAVLVFILPPSWEELRSRLERRGEDSPEVIEVRLKNAAEEMAQVSKFDFVIINEQFERALFDLKAVVHAQRLKYAAQRRARADTFQSLNIT